MKNLRRILVTAVICVIIGAGYFAQRMMGQGPSLQQGAEYVGPEKCLTCHGSIKDAWEKNPHTILMESSDADKKGCEACHGPGGAHTQEPSAAGSITNPAKTEKDEMSALCGKCHFSKEGPPTAPKKSGKFWKHSSHFRKDIACVKCHSVHGSENRDKLLVREEAALCRPCHANKINDKGYTHTPVKMGKCMDCHNPHGEKAAHMVRAEIVDVCQKCHDVAGADLIKKHGGYNALGKNCMSCHDPHSFSKEKHLIKENQHPPFKNRTCTLCHKNPADPGSLDLKKDAKEICTTCHGDKVFDFDGNAVKHFPVQERMCTACHSPHASKVEKLLRDKPVVMCVKCHENVDDQLSGKYPHPPVATGNCFLCHKPHGSANEKLLNEAPDDLCGKCHQNIKFSHPLKLNTKNPAKGEYVRCYSCHNVHGSDFPKILPSDETAMCNGCHGKDTMKGMKVVPEDEEDNR